MLGVGLNSIGLLAYFSSEYSILLVMMFSFAGGFFFIHSILSGLANHIAREHKGVVNGLYISIYYFSGALASWLPGLVYDAYNWNTIMFLLIAILALGAWFVTRLKIVEVND